MSKLSRLMMALGYQGGTISQAAEITGLRPFDFLQIESNPTAPLYQVGLAAGCGFAKETLHHLGKKMKGEPDFWAGVIDSTVF